MSILNLILLIIIIFLILISGFLSGSETAITAASKARVISKIKKGDNKAKYLKTIIDNKDSVISSLLLSNNLVNILASSLATAFFYDLFGVTGIFYSTLLMTLLLVIFAEVLPKTYSINKPTRTALIISPTIYYLNKFLRPFVYVINKIVNLMMRNKESNDYKLEDEQSEEELLGVIDLYKTSNPDSEHEKEMLQSILTLNDTTVEEIFTHRKNIYSINTELSLDEIERHAKCEGSEINSVKKLLAFEATKLCHGEEAAKQAAETALKMFENNVLAEDLPTIEIDKEELDKGIPAYIIFHKSSLASSGGEARRLIKGNGAKINDILVKDENMMVTSFHCNEDGIIKLAAGKKRHSLVKVIN